MPGGRVGKVVAELSHELRRTDNSPGDKLLRVSIRSVEALRLRPHVSLSKRIIVELTAPPKQFRGLRDLVVRRGTEADLEPLATIDDTDRDLVRARFARGDFAYVGAIGDDVVCHTWFHRGPAPFEEDRTVCATWTLDDTTFWSYNGAARADARSSGVFVKLFQSALREMFEVHGGSRVQGCILDTNRGSLSMHERMGFASLGALTTVALPGVKWLRWDAEGASRQWFARRRGDFALRFPPA